MIDTIPEGIKPFVPFRYECTLCGQCCSGDMKVFLNPYDLFILGRHLGYKHSRELYQKRVLIDDEGQNGIPWPRLSFKGSPVKFCPFVENHWLEKEAKLKALCSLQYTAKPLICRLAPVTRTLDSEIDEESFTLTPPIEGCPGFDQEKEQSLEEYLEPLRAELLLEKRFFNILSKCLDRGEKPEELSRYFHFPLDLSFDIILSHWEEALN